LLSYQLIFDVPPDWKQPNTHLALLSFKLSGWAEADILPYIDFDGALIDAINKGFPENISLPYL